ncbi:MAG: insulinase family protein [Eubacteriales bacterium]|nr:insulinase family protein [Eubacteriales bacterium]
MDYTFSKRERLDPLSNAVVEIYTHQRRGLTVYYWPKQRFKQHFAAFLVHVGASKLQIYDAETQRIVKLPYGTAHLLEHMLLSRQRANTEFFEALEELYEAGVDVNAFTSYDHSLFYLNATQNAERAVESLLSTLLSSDFDPDALEREKKVIACEAAIYEEMPENCAFLAAMAALFPGSAISVDIIGENDSIVDVDLRLLRTLHQQAYSPREMTLLLCGDYAIESLLVRLDKILDSLPSPSLGPQLDVETEELASPDIEGVSRVYVELDSRKPYAVLAYRDPYFDQGQKLRGIDRARRQILVELSLELLFSNASSFYQRALDAGLIDDSFSVDYQCYENFATASLSGYTRDPEALMKMVEETIENRHETEDLSPLSFERQKRYLLGTYLRDQDSIDCISDWLCNAALLGINRMYYASMLKELRFDEIDAALESVLINSKVALAVASKSIKRR